MLCFRSKQRQVNKEIEKRIKKDKNDLVKEVKVLLLGTHQSGKSTLLRMLRVVHGEGYSDDEKRSFIVHIYNQVVNAIQELIVEMDLQKVITSPLQMSFMDHIDRITESNYIPNVYDILHCTINSCGMTEHSYNIDGHLLRFIDIRGARTERRKWIHYFDNISALLFIVALSDYNKIESYSDNENRLEIATSLFKTIIDYPWFQNCGIMLFLNKKDVFEEQIIQTDLVDYFPEYKGPKKNAHEATEFIIKMFVELNTDHDRIIYPYSVCLLDAENVRSVLASAIKDMVMNQNLMKNTISTCCCF